MLVLGTPRGTLPRGCIRASPSSVLAGTVAAYACGGDNHSSRPSLHEGVGAEAAPLKTRPSAAPAGPALDPGPAGESDSCVSAAGAAGPALDPAAFVAFAAALVAFAAGGAVVAGLAGVEAAVTAVGAAVGVGAAALVGPVGTGAFGFGAVTA